MTYRGFFIEYEKDHEELLYLVEEAGVFENPDFHMIERHSRLRESLEVKKLVSYAKH